MPRYITGLVIHDGLVGSFEIESVTSHKKRSKFMGYHFGNDREIPRYSDERWESENA